MTTHAGQPSDSTLRATPARVLTFLFAIGTCAPIRAAMTQAGYTAADHAEGWRLLMKAGEIRDGASTATAIARSTTALQEVQKWVHYNFRRFQAALERLHPDWLGLFPDIDPRYPTETLLALVTLMDALTQGEASHDSSLLATLAQRGLTSAEVARLSHLLRDAQSVDLGQPTSQPEADDRTAELSTLYKWHRDWVESAKGCIKRKDFRRVMGIGTDG